MIMDVLFYVTIYAFLFVSVFWLLVFAFKKEEMKRETQSKERPGLTILVPAFNMKDHIKRCLKSLLNQDYPNLRILVVDDGSKDTTLSVVENMASKHENIDYITQENKGKAAALNSGLRHVKTELFGFLDADSHLSKNTLKHMVGNIQGNTVSCIAAIKPYKAKTITSKIQKIEYMITSLTRKLMHFLGAVHYTPAFAIYKTSVIKKLGGFDENNLTEDLEIGLRLQDNGYNIATSLKGFVYTVVPETFKDLMKQRIRWYRGNINNIIKYKHMLLNKRFGHLGLFVLPVQYLLLALSTPILLSGVINAVAKGMQAITNVFLVNFDISYMFSKTHLSLSSNTLFWGLLVFSFLIMMRLSRINIKENVSKLEYVFYIALYPFINVILWITAVLYEVVGAEKKW